MVLVDAITSQRVPGGPGKHEILSRISLARHQALDTLPVLMTLKRSYGSAEQGYNSAPDHTPQGRT
jgi:hypothetical protein